MSRFAVLDVADANEVYYFDTLEEANTKAEEIVAWNRDAAGTDEAWPEPCDVVVFEVKRRWSLCSLYDNDEFGNERFDLIEDSTL